MGKKELGLLALVLVIGAVTTALNPRFLSSVNLLNMANLIGLFGIFSIGQGLVIITGGIDLAVGSVFALLGVVFIDLLANHGVVAFGAGLAAARALAEEVENLARQYLALRAAGLAPALLTTAEMEEVAAGFADYARPG